MSESDRYLQRARELASHVPMTECGHTESRFCISCDRTRQHIAARVAKFAAEVRRETLEEAAKLAEARGWSSAKTAAQAWEAEALAAKFRALAASSPAVPEPPKHALDGD